MTYKRTPVMRPTRKAVQAAIAMQAPLEREIDETKFVEMTAEDAAKHPSQIASMTGGGDNPTRYWKLLRKAPRRWREDSTDLEIGEDEPELL